MVTVNEAISWARDWEDYRDDAGAKVWQQYAPADYTGSSYCGAGQGMICKHFGLELAPTTHQRIIYVPYVVADARKAGKWILSKNSKPGDWVIFSWGNGYHDIAAGNADHIGMIVANNPAKSTVTTFEFNTTDAAGNGPRGAFLRTRSRSDIMGCVDRQHAYANAPTTPPKPSPINPPAKPTYYIGSNVQKAWAKDLGTTADGEISSQDAGQKGCFNVALWPCIQWAAPGHAKGSRLIVAFQRKHGLTPDGIVGPKTMRAIQAWAGLKGSAVDGVGGPITTAALCRKLGFK